RTRPSWHLTGSGQAPTGHHIEYTIEPKEEDLPMMHRLNAAMAPKILCVDDDMYLTDLLHYALTRDGYKVSVANTGTAAPRADQTDPPDAVVLDVHLPDMS